MNKSRSQEIIDNHIKALEEELEWYQAKNLEWQKESNEWLEKTEWIQQEADGGRFAGYHRADVIKTLFDELRAKLSERRYTGIRIDGTWLDFVELQNENARLREQLRWHDSNNEPPNKSGHYIVMTTLGMLALMYYNYTSTYGWSTPGIVSKWCYIPDDRGTDCTPEGE